MHIPERLTDPELQDAMAKVLVPPPVAKVRRDHRRQRRHVLRSRDPGPHRCYVDKGDHFEAGDPLYIVEVMKMFNKVYAPFAGTVDEVLVRGRRCDHQQGAAALPDHAGRKDRHRVPRGARCAAREATARYLARISAAGADACTRSRRPAMITALDHIAIAVPDLEQGDQALHRRFRPALRGQEDVEAAKTRRRSSRCRPRISS
jgi:pyruvate/2-oxoglutarate dehydrogenase complex dihydrolipoamide acyltransferase (E2) component